MEFALNMVYGCLDQAVHYCRPYLASDSSLTLSDKAICQEAADMCNDNVFGKTLRFAQQPYYALTSTQDRTILTPGSARMIFESIMMLVPGIPVR